MWPQLPWQLYSHGPIFPQSFKALVLLHLPICLPLGSMAFVPPTVLFLQEPSPFSHLHLLTLHLLTGSAPLYLLLKACLGSFPSNQKWMMPLWASLAAHCLPLHLGVKLGGGETLGMWHGHDLPRVPHLCLSLAPIPCQYLLRSLCAQCLWALALVLFDYLLHVSRAYFCSGWSFMK